MRSDGCYSNGHLLLDLRAPQTQDHLKAEILKTMINTSSLAAPSRPVAKAEQSSTQSTTNQAIESTSIPSTGSPATSSPSDQGTIPLPPTIPAGSDPAANSGATDSAAPTSSSSDSQTSQTSNQPSQAIQNLLVERRRRLEIDQKEKEAVEKADRKAKAEVRKEPMTAAPDSAKAKQAVYALQQRKRQQDAKLERERILRQIEHDKAERKEKEERRRVLAKADAEGKKDSELVEQQLNAEMNSPRPTRSKECSIQIRMFDGSTIRNRFPSEDTLRAQIRPWVDKQKSDSDFPYTFKHILTPLPNRTLSISDEEEDLQSLGLTPSATLVIVPVQGYTAAYTGGQGIVSRGASAGYNVVSAGAGLVTGALGMFLGLGQATSQEDRPATPETTTQASAESDARGTGSGVNIRTLRDQQDREDHQFYNGNQVNILLDCAFSNI